MIYDRVVYSKVKPKYKVGDYIKLIDDNWEVEKLSHILEINEDLETPDYYIEAINKKTQEIIKMWIDEEEIDKKTNSKDKIKFKKIETHKNI